MFRLPNTFPNIKSSTQEVTDFLEWECIKSGSISIIETLKPILITSDEENFDGIEDETDYVNDELFTDIIIEINKRRKACGNRYPFDLYNKDYNLLCNRNHRSFFLYCYLLLSTRLNMKDDSTWANIDGTGLLEKVAAEIAKEYLNYRSQGFVFGTSSGAGFKANVENLILLIGEGQSFTNKDKIPLKVKDANLDVVAWTSFADEQHSQFIAFGQCKTGETWKDAALLELVPENFCSTWMANQPIVLPVKMFFCSKYFPFHLYSWTKMGGLVFDRYRIMDFLPDYLDGELLLEIISWCRAVITAYSIKDAVPKHNAMKRKT